VRSRVKFLPRISSKRIASLTLMLGCVWVVETASGQGAPPGAQPAPGTRSAAMQSLLKRSQAPTPDPAGQSPAPAPPAPGSTAAVQPVPAPVPANQPPAAVKSVRIVHDKEGAAIEIVSSRPVPPALQTLSNPARLVIDLPNANVAVKQKHLSDPHGEQFSAVHVDQFQVSPPVTRIVVDLDTARQYTWDAAGNRLMVRSKPPEAPKPAPPPPPAQPMTVPTFSAGAKPAVVPVPPRPSGPMVLAGSRMGSGSSVTAGAETAVLHIARGGEVHVCPGSTVSVTASKTGQELMLGMSTGGLETHYQLGGAAADSILTPDFRIVLTGPGDFNYAVSANSRGDTCVRALLGNTSSAIVSELVGDRSYQVRPTEQVVFHEGRVDQISNDLPADCGCPPPPPPAVRPEAAPTQVVSDANLPSNVQLPTSMARSAMDPMLPAMSNPIHTGSTGLPGATVNIASAKPETTPLPPTRPNDVKVQIEAPFVFRGGANAASTTATQPSPNPKPETQHAKLDPTAPIPGTTPSPKTADSGPVSDPKAHHGFFGRVKGFFSSMFHKGD